MSTETVVPAAEPSVHIGNYIRILQSGNSKAELERLGKIMDEHSEQGFRVVSSFYGHAGGHISEGVFTVIMEYDQPYMDTCNGIAQRESGLTRRLKGTGR